ncbi:F-box/WD repeat-containing protein 7-like [Lytechinus pictus]|uniref:F-box/WD repeat-containing protein 7-like n=1 Tax=Lytechinus pictus TaxID=7653 RepID=UPI00240E66EE|nr:F-box/WD repeat-containing protein 7-like [Lytechinus pictus]
MDGRDNSNVGSSDSEGIPARPPPKRAKSKSRVWDRVARLARRTRSSREGDSDFASTGEEAGEADLPSEQMDLSDGPSTSSYHATNVKKQQLSDCSSSSEGDLATCGNAVRSPKHTCYNPPDNSEVIYQHCVRPSAVKAMFRPAELKLHSDHVQLRKKRNPSSTISCRHSDCALEVQKHRNDCCHCPSCCCCRRGNLGTCSGSWPRNRSCPLRMSLRMPIQPSKAVQSPSSSPRSKNLWKRNSVQGPLMTKSVSLQSERPGSAMYDMRIANMECGEEEKAALRANRSLDMLHSAVMHDVKGLSRSIPLFCDQDRTINEQNGNEQKIKEKPVDQWKDKVSGLVFKERLESILGWFREFNDQQKNMMMKRLVEECDLPQMHMLSVTMEPILHQHCPHNCQDLLSWLPNQLSTKILSYLDPVSLCRCAGVNRAWKALAEESYLWSNLCLQQKWRLSQVEEHKQMINHMGSSIQWKQVFAERYRLRRNWLKGYCTVRTFEGHTQGISCVQFDDTRIVSGSSDKTIKVWNIRTNSPWSVQTLVGHSGTVRCLHLEGNRLVSGSTDTTIKVWDLSMQSSWSSIACRVTMTGHHDMVRCLQVDDDKVVSGSYDRTLKVWDIRTGQCRLTLSGHLGAVICLQFDDFKIISGSADKTIKIWSLSSGLCMRTLMGHQNSVTCLQFDASKIISGSLDSNLKFWDLKTGECISTIDWVNAEGHTGVVRCLQADSWRVVSAADDRTLKVWNIDTRERIVTLRHHSDGVTCLQFNNSKIVSGSYDKTVKLWDFSAV